MKSVKFTCSQSAGFSYSSPSNRRIDFRARLNTGSMIVFMWIVFSWWHSKWEEFNKHKKQTINSRATKRWLITRNVHENSTGITICTRTSTNASKFTSSKPQHITNEVFARVFLSVCQLQNSNTKKKTSSCIAIIVKLRPVPDIPLFSFGEFWIILEMLNTEYPSHAQRRKPSN